MGVFVCNVHGKCRYNQASGKCTPSPVPQFSKYQEQLNKPNINKLHSAHAAVGTINSYSTAFPKNRIEKWKMTVRRPVCILLKRHAIFEPFKSKPFYLSCKNIRWYRWIFMIRACEEGHLKEKETSMMQTFEHAKANSRIHHPSANQQWKYFNSLQIDIFFFIQSIRLFEQEKNLKKKQTSFSSNTVSINFHPILSINKFFKIFSDDSALSIKLKAICHEYLRTRD